MKGTSHLGGAVDVKHSVEFLEIFSAAPLKGSDFYATDQRARRE